MSWKEFHQIEINKTYYKKLDEKVKYLYTTETYPPKDLII
jgi:hypothetical protein